MSTLTRGLVSMGALVVAAGAAAAPVPTPELPASSRGAELIAKATAAFGGERAVDSVKALELHGTGSRRVQGNDLPVTTTARYFFPDRSYQELQLPMGTMKTVVGPREGFIVAGEGSLPLPDTERQALLRLMNRNLVAVLQARTRPGFTATVSGTGTVDGKAVEMVKVDTGSDTITLAIEPATGLILQTTSESGGGGSSPAGTLVVTYSDYRKAGPIVYPHAATGTFSGQPAFTSKLDRVVVNPKLDEALFQPPPPHPMLPGAEDQPLPPVPPAPSPAASPTPPPSPRPTPTPPSGE
jgi:hypothetical protein